MLTQVSKPRYTKVKYALIDPIGFAGEKINVKMGVEIVYTGPPPLYAAYAVILYVGGPSSYAESKWFPYRERKGMYFSQYLGSRKGVFDLSTWIKFPEKGFHTVKLGTLVVRHDPTKGYGVYQYENLSTRYVLVL